jgi:hypothetical protein
MAPNLPAPVSTEGGAGPEPNRVQGRQAKSQNKLKKTPEMVILVEEIIQEKELCLR